MPMLMSRWGSVLRLWLAGELYVHVNVCVFVCMYL